MVVIHLDLGPQGLLLLFACLAFPLLVGLIVRREWRKSVSRGEEVRRLLLLAKEEDARAELEASCGYGYDGDVIPPQPPRDYFCAACYSPTTTRCSRCKAVWYCSGKCQIIHWRQGHSEECHPPVDMHDCGWEAIDNQKDEHDGANVVNEARHLLNSTSTGKTVAGLAESGCSDHAQVKLETENSSFQSPSTSFSGFSSSAENTSSDDACGGESICSNESGGSDERISDTNARDLIGNPTDKHADDTKSRPQIFQASVNAADGSSSCSTESTETIMHLGSDADGGPTVEPPTKMSAFWRSNMDSNEKEETSSGHFQSPSLVDSQIQCASDSGIHLRVADASNLHAKHVGDHFISNHDMLNQGAIINKLTISSRETISKCEKYDSIGDEDIKPSSQLRNKEDESTLSNAEANSLTMDSLKICLPEQPVLLVREHFAGVDDTNVAVSSHHSSSASNTFNSWKASVGDTGICRPVRSSLSKHESYGRATHKVGSFGEKGIFSYKLFVKLYTWKEVELLPCGFINCGNSCYANAILQCLAFTPPLTAYFLQGLHCRTCTKKDWCFMCKFERIILKAKVGISPISPIEIASHLRNIGSQLSNGRQEDAHEFLRYVIDAMQSICLAESGRKCTSLDEETTLIGLTFGGYLRSKIRCTKCQSKSERHERMMDLTVEIEGDIGTLEEALHRFTETETLDGDNKYQCSSCKSYEKARKKLTVLEAPNILTISLKRFQTGGYGKINKRITFPEILNLAPYMSGTSDNLSVYRLYGVIVHLDVMNATFSGHYICYVKNPQNKWFKIDDSTVTPVELASVLRVGAYMLLYARCSPRAPRSVRNSMVPMDAKHRTGPSKANERLSVLSRKSIGRIPSHINPIGSPLEGSAGIAASSPEFRFSERASEEDSLSDNFSLFSSNSDEGSCSTDSTRDSASVDDLSDYVLGDVVRRGGSPWRTSDSETCSSTSSSPAHSRQSPVLRLPAVEKSGVLSPAEMHRLSTSRYS